MEQQLKILLLPKDPNDDKNVMVEIRLKRRRRRSSPFCLGALQNVCAFCGEQPLED